jgi:hypothetical protein
VRGTATFAEILDAELNCTKMPPGSGRAYGARNRPLTTPLFVFDVWKPVAPALNVPRLSAQERRALAALNDLGADLVIESLSSTSLRRAFRRLARRYHPDRHPGSTAAEQERMSRVFIEAAEHYRVLAAALRSA